MEHLLYARELYTYYHQSSHPPYEMANTSPIRWIGKLRLREEDWTRRPVQGYPAHMRWDLNPVWLELVPADMGQLPRGARGAKASCSPGGLARSSREARAPLGSPISKSREIRGSNKLC